MIGNRLDKYELLEKIGEGGMATVYRGTHATLDREVAVKVLHPHLSSAIKNRQRFAREARAIERLQHDGILRIFDYSGEEAEHCYIVTELIRGDTLKVFLQQRGLLPSELVAQMGIKIAEGLAYAHQEGVVHRDIKPENVMIREDGVLKLMDFGIARFVEESAITMTGSLIGSPAYMSPEQVLERTPDRRSDLFSLGAMLFNLVTGQLAFSGSNPSVILKKVIEGDHPHILDLQPTVSAELAQLIEEMLAPSPEDRPADAQEVVDRLRSVLDGSGIAEESPSWSLLAYSKDPDDYEERLRNHLEHHLLSHGKNALLSGQHPVARSDFNRLLALSPEHPEVMDLLADLSTLGHSRPLQKSLLRWAGIVILSAGIPGIWIWSKSSTPAPIPVIEEPLQDALVGPPAVDSTAAAMPATAEPAILPVQDAVPSLSPETLPPVRGPGTQHRTQKDNRTDSDSIDVGDGKEGSTEGAAEEPIQRPSATKGTLWVGLSNRTRGVWADVYIDGRSKGRSRGGGATLRIEVEPGSHILKVTNDYAQPFERRFDLDVGQELRFENIELQKRPVSIRIHPDLGEDCTVFIAERNLGLIGLLRYQSALNDPADLQLLRIACPDGTIHGPYDLAVPSPGDVVRFPPRP